MKIYGLQLFAEGGEASAPTGAETAHETKVAVADNDVNLETESVQSNENSEETWESLINGKYKDDFENSLKMSFEEKSKTLKEEIKSLKQKNKSYNKAFEALAVKYDIESENVEAVLSAVEGDESYYEEAAAREGLTVEQYKKLQSFEKQQREFEEMRAVEEAKTQAQKDLEGWFKQGISVKESYPNFDLGAELQNKDFLSLLKNGIAVQTAYEVIHMDDIKKSTAESAERTIVAKIQSKGSRPTENGASSPAGSIVKPGMALNKQQREEIARRAQRGETIRF